MAGLFASPPPPPPPPPPAPMAANPSVQQAAQEQATESAQAMGRASTILTGGQGQTTPPTVQKKVLLGG